MLTRFTHTNPTSLLPNDLRFDSDFRGPDLEIQDSKLYLTDSQPLSDWKDYTDVVVMILTYVPDSKALAAVRELTLDFRDYIQSPLLCPAPAGNNVLIEPAVAKGRGQARIILFGAVINEYSTVAHVCILSPCIGSASAFMAAPSLSSRFKAATWEI